MLRILHLHPPRCDFQTQRCLEQLFKNKGDEFALTSRSIGPGGDYQNLPEAIFRWRFGHRDQFDLVHAWTPADLVVAAAAGFSRLIFSPQARIHPNSWRWIERILRKDNVEIVCPTLFMQNMLISHGANPDRCRVISPAVDLDRLSSADPDIRDRLGLSKSDLVLLAPGESLRESAHVSSLWATAILNFLDPNYRLLVWARGPMVNSLRRFARVSAIERLLVLAEPSLGERVDFEQIAPLGDLALFCGRKASPVLPLGVCLAAALPVVASQSPETNEFLQNGVNALVEPSVNPRRLAQAVRDLQNDPGRRERLAQAGRSTAADRFSVSRFIEAWRKVYSRSAVLNAGTTVASNARY